MRIPEEKKKRERYRRNIWNNKDWEFPQINVGHQAIGPGSSENTKQSKCPQMTPRHIILKLQKIKNKENILKKSRREKYLTCGWTNIRITSDFFSETRQAGRQWSEIFKVFREKKIPCETITTMEILNIFIISKSPLAHM